MATVWQVVGVGSIEHVVVQTLVHRPVECQTCLTTVQHAVLVVALLLVAEHFAPYAHLGEVTLECFFFSNVFCTSYRKYSRVVLFRAFSGSA